MSRFLKEKYRELEPYTPGEQPQDKGYVKLNTNESPYGTLNRYPDPDCNKLKEVLAERYGVSKENISCTNGSDEALFFVFDGFFDEVAFPDVTYGFYKVFCDRLGIKKRIIPLDEGYGINPEEYKELGCGIAIANPNAQTGRALSRKEVETIVSSNRENVVVVDEAYVDFGAESAVPLVQKYDNLIVVMTFSKSRSMAGGRLGFAIAGTSLINDIETLRYSMNPYNVSTPAQAAGLDILAHDDIYMENCRRVMETRERVCGRLDELGLTYVPSKANFLLVSAKELPGERIYTGLKERGVLVRYFNEDRLKDYVRVTIGDDEQMDIFLERLEEIL